VIPPQPCCTLGPAQTVRRARWAARKSRHQATWYDFMPSPAIFNLHSPSLSLYSRHPSLPSLGYFLEGRRRRRGSEGVLLWMTVSCLASPGDPRCRAHEQPGVVPKARRSDPEQAWCLPARRDAQVSGCPNNKNPASDNRAQITLKLFSPLLPPRHHVSHHCIAWGPCLMCFRPAQDALWAQDLQQGSQGLLHDFAPDTRAMDEFTAAPHPGTRCPLYRPASPPRPLQLWPFTLSLSLSLSLCPPTLHSWSTKPTS
jgi:hypothetical protein